MGKSGTKSIVKKGSKLGDILGTKYGAKSDAKPIANKGSKSGSNLGTTTGAKLGAKGSAKDDAISGANFGTSIHLILCLKILVGVKNVKISAILINIIELSKKL